MLLTTTLLSAITSLTAHAQQPALDFGVFIQATKTVNAQLPPNAVLPKPRPSTT